MNAGMNEGKISSYSGKSLSDSQGTENSDSLDTHLLSCEPSEKFYQVAASTSPIKKAKMIYSIGDMNFLYKVVDIEGRTQIVFNSDCAVWNSGASDLSRARLHIDGLNALRKEGV